MGTHIQGVEGSWWQWEYGDPRIIRTAGKKAAKAFSTLLHGDDDSMMPLEMHRAGIVVTPVEGAPGGGNEALTRAVVAALQKAGIAVTEDPRQAAFVLRGTVAVADAAGGLKSVRIEWTVTTFDGTRLGRASQENALAADTVDGDWAQVARLVAGAAVEGIRMMLEGKRQSRRGRAIPPPRPPRQPLPRVPGRAPPPVLEWEFRGKGGGQADRHRP